MLTLSQGLAYLDSTDREIYGLSNTVTKFGIILEYVSVREYWNHLRQRIFRKYILGKLWSVVEFVFLGMLVDHFGTLLTIWFAQNNVDETEMFLNVPFWVR